MRPLAPHTLGPVLARLRRERGWSQLRTARELAAVSGCDTVTRHEISRWERQERTPGDFWLDRLALLFEVPAAELRRVRACSPRGAAATGEVSRLRAELCALARRWLADPGAPLAPIGPPWRALGASGAPPPVTGADLAQLRRLDDLLGGTDLAGHGAQRLESALVALGQGGRGERRPLLRLVAGAGQLAGWQAADAGDAVAALHAYRLALLAAAAAGDRTAAGHVLASASHLFATVEPGTALLLARAGQGGAGRGGPPALRALLAHRVAFAAALLGRRPAADAALTVAEQALARHRPAAAPDWSYWLDPAAAAGMTGRTLVALGRPLRAVPLLRAGARSGRLRERAVYGSWLARAYAELGEVEQAVEAGGAALVAAVGSGSARAAAEVTGVARLLGTHRDRAPARRHLRLVRATRPWLPGAAPPAEARQAGPIFVTSVHGAGRRCGPPDGDPGGQPGGAP